MSRSIDISSPNLGKAETVLNNLLQKENLEMTKGLDCATKNLILENCLFLYNSHQNGDLGGLQMPEDQNPDLDKNSEANLRYLTLPMALNYQRNSYTLWGSALKTYRDEQTHFVFESQKVVATSFVDLQTALVKYKLALQATKQVQIWQTLCGTLDKYYQGSVLNLLQKCHFDIAQILNEIQVVHKKDFPYLSGHKIANYWLFVLTQYTNLPFVNKQALSIAPDTHITQASQKLGLTKLTDNAQQIAQKWSELLQDQRLLPIDMHTPLWLWSRSNFQLNLPHTNNFDQNLTDKNFQASTNLFDLAEKSLDQNQKNLLI